LRERAGISDTRHFPVMMICMSYRCSENVLEFAQGRLANPYLLMRMANELVLYAGRLILAYNRILYPYHKWLMHVLRDAPEKLDNFMDLIDALLAEPSKQKAEALRDCLKAYHNWGVDILEANASFMLNVEWSWRSGNPPLADW
jgi:hypothetical protein